MEEKPDGDGEEQRGEPRQMDDPAAGQIDHHEGDDGDDDRRAEIRLQQDQSHDDPRNAEGDEQSLTDLPDVVDPLGQEMGQEEDQGDLGHLGDLKREYPEVEPADGAAGPDPQRGDPDARMRRTAETTMPGQASFRSL